MMLDKVFEQENTKNRNGQKEKLSHQDNNKKSENDEAKKSIQYET
jgi:hypothetical protein